MLFVFWLEFGGDVFERGCGKICIPGANKLLADG